MTKSRAIALATAITATVALGLVGGFTQLKAALAQTEGVRVASRQRFVSGRPEGEVLVGDTVVMRIRAAAGGFTATQRAERVSNRLQQVLNERQIRPEDLRVARVNGDYVVMVNNDLLITADTYHAALNAPRRNAWQPSGVTTSPRRSPRRSPAIAATRSARRQDRADCQPRQRPARRRGARGRTGVAGG